MTSRIINQTKDLSSAPGGRTGPERSSYATEVRRFHAYSSVAPLKGDSAAYLTADPRARPSLTDNNLFCFLSL